MSQCPHRVGQLYLSFDATSPETIWPGTKWTRITGRFLRAAADTATGGSDSVALTESHLPRHSHTGPSHSHPAGTLAASGGGSHRHDLLSGIDTYISLYRVGVSASSSGNWFGAFDGLSTTEMRPNGSFRTIKTTTAPAHTHGVTGSTGAAGTGSTGTTGGGKPFDNRPAYQDVHAWRRTA
ncbi:phage baseplate protein [Adlercreutzia muris]|uniref:phage baseplate protein n=1 Tax=Adlercreutzia muris TaxID=1796610 RepID=UPI003513D790